MDGLGSSLLVVGGLAVLGAAAVLGLFCGAAIIAARIGHALFPAATRGKKAIGAAGCLPLALVALFGAALTTLLSDDFRGPEILGIGIAGLAAGFAVIVAWPVGAWAAYRFLHPQGPGVPYGDTSGRRLSRTDRAR